MVSFNPNNFPVTVKNHIPVKDASEYSGYSLQYMRRLLRSGALEGIKIGQMWLIDMQALESYLQRVESSSDRRYGPR